MINKQDKDSYTRISVVSFSYFLLRHHRFHTMSLVLSGTKRKRRDFHPPCHLLLLPNELLVIICRMLPKEDHLWLALANKHLYSLFHSLILPPPTCRLYTGVRSFTSSISRLQFALNSSVTPSVRTMCDALVTVLANNNTQAADIIVKSCPAVRYCVSWHDTQGAAVRGHLEAIQWILRNAVKSDRWRMDMAFTFAVSAGHLHILQWLYKNLYAQLPILSHDVVVESGDIVVIEWLWDHGFSCNTYTCEAASRQGRIHILTWLREKGCPWDQWTCINAAVHGHLAVLQWARQHGAPWNKAYILASSLTPEIREWVEAQPE